MLLRDGGVFTAFSLIPMSQCSYSVQFAYSSSHLCQCYLETLSNHATSVLEYAYWWAFFDDNSTTWSVLMSVVVIEMAHLWFHFLMIFCHVFYTTLRSCSYLHMVIGS